MSGILSVRSATPGSSPRAFQSGGVAVRERAPSVQKRGARSLRPLVPRTDASAACAWATLLLGVLLLTSACGYHVAGKGTALPTSVKVIAVPTFRNDTTRYKAEQVLTQAVVRELLARTKYRVQPAA